MPLPVTALYDLAEATLTALVAGWPDDAQPLPDRQYVSDGTVVWDCESLVVIVNSTFGTDSDVAVEQIIQMGMGFALRAAQIGVLLLRCVPVVNDEGEPPTAEEIDGSANVILRDSIALMNVLVAAQTAGELATCQGLAFERWASQGPTGGFGGGLLQFRALLL